jgi:hypothetical protein
MEQEPGFKLSLADGRELEATRDNTTLFTFIGKLSLYDHVFFLTDQERNMGTYLFNVNPMFDEVQDYMITNDYPAHINLRDVAQCDIDAFDKMVSTDVAIDLEGGIPEDWN